MLGAPRGPSSSFGGRMGAGWMFRLHTLPSTRAPNAAQDLALGSRLHPPAVLAWQEGKRQREAGLPAAPWGS